MRISLISAAVCCALFSAWGASAAPLTIEQRLAQLEARLNHAEQEAGEAIRRAQQAEQRTSAAEQRAAAAEKQVQGLSQRTAATEQKQQATDKQKVKAPKDAVPHHGGTQHQQRRRTGGQAGKVSHKPAQRKQR